jgi:hypothetical protein
MKRKQAQINKERNYDLHKKAHFDERARLWAFLQELRDIGTALSPK